MRLTMPLAHATPADRATYREQLAILAERQPALAAPLLAALDPVERLAVAQIADIRHRLAPPLRVEPLPDGGEVRYLGRPDGVYVQRVDAYGTPGPLEPHGPWSVWHKEHADA